MSNVSALTLEDDVACLDEIETLEPEQATVPFRSLPLYPRQLRCLAEVAAAFGNRPFTRVDVASLSGDDYVNGADDPLWQLLQHELVTVIATRSPHSTYSLTIAGLELAESLRQEYPLWQERVRADTVIDAFSEQLLVALHGILPGGRGKAESAAALTRSLFVKTTYLRVKRRLIEIGMLREDGWLEITLRGRSYLDLLPVRDPDDVWTLDNNRNPSTRGRLRVNFLPFPPRVRTLVKEHVRHGMSIRHQDYRLDQMPHLTEFIRTYLRRHPGADDLAGLTIEDIDAFARASCIRRTGESRATRSVHSRLSAIRTFLTFVLEKEPSLLPATFQPRWLWGRVISRDGRPVLKSDPGAHLSLMETPEQAELRARAHFERDVWHIDALPGVPRKDHWPQKVISFVRVPECCRSAAKAYAQYLLAGQGRSIGTLIGNIRYMARFLEYWLMRYPERTSLTDLRVQDLSDYIAHIRGSNATPHQIHDHYYGVRRFVVWLQRVEHPLAPSRLADRLFDPTIAPRPPRQSQTPQKWIPESVLRQLDAKIQHLDSMYVPVVTILRASGWRISDVVSLRYDICVQHEEDKWWLVGDIQKTRVLGHRIPITEEVALAISAHAEVVKASLTAAENPRHYLFPAVTPQRRGRPVAGTSVLHAIHKFVQKQEIVGDDGKPFRLKTHAFRHSKAVELINNGMPLDYVRRWLAHLSPEMTVVYAKIRDDVLRERWEQATAEGVLRLDKQHVPELISVGSLEDMNELELERIRGNLDATRTEKGYCFKPQKMPCTWAEIACYTCTQYATTPKFLPEFEEMERDLLFQIELGRETGRAHWIEKNERKLALIRPIISTLRAGNTVARLTKAQRETVAQHELGKAAQSGTPE